MGVAHLERSLIFYDAILAPLGFVRVWTAADAAGYGHPGGDDEFALKQHIGEPFVSPRSHIAFNASSHDAVRAFHAAALAHGAVDDGPPDFCPEYGDDYFAVFVEDADGYRLEAKQFSKT